MFHPVISSLKVSMYLLAIMPCTNTWLSSRVSTVSSDILMVYTLVLLCCANRYSTVFQVSLRMESDFSILASFWALSTISLTSSSYLWSSKASKSSSLKLASMTSLTPVFSMSCCQCLSLMSGEDRSATSGMQMRKFLALLSIPEYTS